MKLKIGDEVKVLFNNKIGVVIDIIPSLFDGLSYIVLIGSKKFNLFDYEFTPKIYKKT